LLINLGAAEDLRFELFEPEGRVFKSPGANLGFINQRFRPSEKGFGQQPVLMDTSPTLPNTPAPIKDLTVVGKIGMGA